MQKYYVDFAEKTGIEFDVESILNSIDDSESIFWNKVFKNNYLLGLLMGYGQKNSYLFYWAQKKGLLVNSISICRFKELSRLNKHSNILRKRNIDIHDLEIPYFATFEIDSEDVERYVREREKIVQFMKEKDLVPFVLKQLGC